MRNFFIISLLLLIITHLKTQETEPKLIKKSLKNLDQSNFLFGSCNQIYEDSPSTIFEQMDQQKSEVFVWLGDSAYLDTEYSEWSISNDPETVKNSFDSVYNDKYYAQFRKKRDILGVYDDHDLNLNDADYKNPVKEWTRQLYLDFLDEPQDSIRRTRDDGIYESYYMGDNRVKLILLDTRYNRNMETQDTLGEKQWIWLENELKDQNPLVFFIASGMQILREDGLTENFQQKSKLRLLKMIKESGKRVVLLSGDIHTGEFLSQPCSKEYLGYDITEFTSSGIKLKEDTIKANFLRIILKCHFSNINSTDKDRYHSENYGKVQINWKEPVEQSQIILQLYGNNPISDPPVLERKFLLSDISPGKKNEEEYLWCEYMNESKKQRTINGILRYYKEGNVLIWKTTILILLVIGIILLGLGFLVFQIIKKICKKDEKKEKKQ